MLVDLSNLLLRKIYILFMNNTSILTKRSYCPLNKIVLLIHITDHMIKTTDLPSIEM